MWTIQVGQQYDATVPGTAKTQARQCLLPMATNQRKGTANQNEIYFAVNKLGWS